MSYDEKSHWLEKGLSYLEHMKNKPEKVKRLYAYQMVNILLEMRPVLENAETLIEMGCGYGRITKAIARSYPDLDIYAFDLSPDQIKTAQQFNSAPNIKYGVGSIYDVDLGYRADVVLAVELLMHLKPENIEKAILSMAAHTKEHVFNVDWYERRPEPSDFCFMHLYADLYTKAGFSSIEVKYLQKRRYPLRQAIYHAWGLD